MSSPDNIKSEKVKFLRKAQQLQKKSMSEKPVKKLQASVGPFSYSSESNSRQTATECLAQNNRRIDPAPSVFRKITPYSACTEASKESNFTREPSKSTPSPDHADGSLFFSDLESEHQLSSTPIPKKYTATSHFNTDYVSHQFSELIMKCSELESRLKKQTDVNKELKRLLVASIGSNLQNSLNHLAQEKAVISHDLNISLEKLAENHEEIDRVSIECDIWRSKFLASRVMIDEIAGWKAQISQQLKESQRALQCILKEHAEINKLMFQSNHCLNEIGISLKLNEMDRDFVCDHQEKDILELARIMAYKTSLLGEQVGLSPLAKSNNNLCTETVPFTTGERLATQVLMCHQHPASPNRGFSSSLNEGKLWQNDRIYSRTSLPMHSNFHYFGGKETESFLLFHCNRCRGEIQNI